MSEESVTAGLTQDDKIMAALGHATIIWPVMGIIAPLVVWAMQREKSDFVAFQALQAAVYHITLVLGGLVWGVCLLCAYFGVFAGAIGMPLSLFLTLGSPETPSEELPPEAVVGMIVGAVVVLSLYLLIFVLILLVFVLWVVSVGYGLYGAVSSLQGKDFRYIIIGSRLERYLEQS